VQGRAGLSGSAAEGGQVVVDGDKDNANATAQGYVIVQTKPQPAPPSVRCGDEYSEGGRADSDSPQARDTQAECGG
jgi:formylmethanofuran dehydrogenase subunit C